MDKWIPVWHYVPIDYNQEIGVFENITQKALFTNNLRGHGLKIRFNNLYNDQPMAIRHAAVGLCNRVTGRRTAPVAVTLQGSEEIFLAPNSQPYSDVLALDITPEDDILLLFYFEKKLRCARSAPPPPGKAGRAPTTPAISTKPTLWALPSRHSWRLHWPLILPPTSLPPG